MPRRKAALVTASATRRGVAIADELASWGLHVMLNVTGGPRIRESRITGMAARYGVDVLYERTDARRREAIDDLLARATSRWGGLDVVVNDIGAEPAAASDAQTIGRWRDALAVSYSAATHATRLALPHMRFNRWGRIVNVAWRTVSMGHPAHAEASHALARFTKAVALELAGMGVTVNALFPQAPGAARNESAELTPTIDGDDSAAECFVGSAAPRPVASARMLARRVAYLCSDAAASVTGTMMPVTSGQEMP